MNAKPNSPKPIPRPKLARYMFDRDLKLAEVGDAIGCSAEQVRRICLPFADPKRQVPGRELMDRIVEWTDGVVQPHDFYLPLTAGAAA